jgi:biopolymer transport protein TolQ
LQSRLEIALDLAVTEQSAKLEQRLGFLATIGSAGPFVGLFGTVWGIMNAFTAIASAENTSLAVVAPGIAEALLAAALGLLAAIPAVIAYNKLSADAGKLIARLEGFADRLVALLSRQIDAGRAL